MKNFWHYFRFALALNWLAFTAFVWALNAQAGIEARPHNVAAVSAVVEQPARVVQKFTMPLTDNGVSYVVVKKRHHDWVTLHEGEYSWFVPLPWSHWTVRYHKV